MSTQAQDVTPRFLRQTAVLQLVPIGKSTLWAKVKTGEFPRPIKISPRVTVWRREEVLAWMDSQPRLGEAS